DQKTRAFRIVADHAAGQQTMPLRMYGGMGGTGCKSQVLKAIIEFFHRRDEDYRYMVLGPTDFTAALLNGSTYHSVFKIPRESKSKNHGNIQGLQNEGSALAALTPFFLDEISMVSCNDFQLLATQAATARNI
ncbi:hypothetical protein B0H19DRAFT_855359, partial [Mycena capillaripes]